MIISQIRTTTKGKRFSQCPWINPIGSTKMSGIVCRVNSSSSMLAIPVFEWCEMV
jgi:hypothetical protein